MDEDFLLGLLIIVTWVIGVLATLSITGFILWAIYKLVTHFL